jgi:mannose-6-phosphate isomerase-like protein (cupin superfamily)
VTTTAGYVLSEPESASRPERDGRVSSQVTIGPEQGSTRLEQRLVSYPPGSFERELDGIHAVMFVTSGTGRLDLGGEEHSLEPETAAFVAAGEKFTVSNERAEPLELVEVAVTAERPPAANRRVVVRHADQPVLSAGIGREFRYLLNQDAGITEVTQFVGVIPPGRAGNHSHTYDEVVYVLEGEGVVHMDGAESARIKRGSCIHLPPLLEHCLENVGNAPMRVLGVFSPAGDPASRATEQTNDVE